MGVGTDAKEIGIEARRKIKAGKELSYDYGKDHFEEYIKPHGCKCEKCQSAIT